MFKNEEEEKEARGDERTIDEGTEGRTDKREKKRREREID